MLNNISKVTKKYLNELIAKSIISENVYMQENEYLSNIDILEELVNLNFITIIKIKEKDVILSHNISKLQREKINNRIDKNNVLYYNIIVSSEIISTMAKERLKNKNIKSGHDKIIFSLINFIEKEKKSEYLFFSNFEIKTKFGISRPDLYIIQNEYDISKIKPTCYEIKHSYNDFKNDIKKPNKRASYLEISPTLYYVCPKNIIPENEVPENCGLIYMDNQGFFEVIIKAKEHKQWENNFNKLLINTLIKHKTNENIDFFINENATINNKIVSGNFYSLYSNDDVILLGKNNLNILNKFTLNSNCKTFRELSLLDESYNSVYDLIGLNILNINQKEKWIYGDNMKCNVFELTELGISLVNKMKELSKTKINNFNINERLIHKKFSYKKIYLNSYKLFDFFIMNKEKKIDKLLLTGFVKIKSEDELKSFLNNEEKINILRTFCQKLAIVNFENNIDRKNIPKEFSLYKKNNYSQEDFPKNEVKRGNKRNIEDVNSNILLLLLREEYFNKQCFIF